MGKTDYVLFVVCIILFSVGVLAGSTKPEILKPKYTFEEINLPDGTPCTIILIESNSAKIGATCDYNSLYSAN